MVHPIASYFLALSTCLLFSCAVEAPSGSADGEDLALADDSGRPAPAYTSFETALRVDVDAHPVLTDEVSAEQADYYVFHADAGEFYELSTENDTFSPDNVIALYDADRNKLASNDDGSRLQGDRFDTRIVFRAPKTGDYFVRVEDLHTPPEYFRSSFVLLYYHLSVRKVSTGASGYASASEPITSERFVEDTRNGYRYLTIVGTFRQDVERIDLPGLADHALIARYHLGGADAYGSTVLHAQVRVNAPDGRLLSNIDCALGQQYFRPPVGEGLHHIELHRHGAPGANPFYVVDLVLLADNPRERSEATNGDVRGAEAIKLSHGTYGRALLLAEVPTGDVDYFEVPSKDATSVLVGCEGEPMGSGVRDLKVELLDSNGRVLQEAQEGPEGLDFVVPLESALPHYVRLSSSGAPSEPIDPWVRCVILVN